MNKEGLGGNSGDQGPMDLWGRLAAVSNNYGEQRPSGAEVNGDMQDGDETQGEQGVATPMTFDDLRQIVTEIDNVYWEYNNKYTIPSRLLNGNVRKFWLTKQNESNRLGSSLMSGAG